MELSEEDHTASVSEIGSALHGAPSGSEPSAALALAAELRKPCALLEEAADEIEGLEADLFLAVSVAYHRGATEWTRLNYPAWFRWLSGSPASPSSVPTGAPEDLK